MDKKNMKTFCPDEWDFRYAHFRENCSDSYSGLTVTLNMRDIEDRDWQGRRKQARCEGGGYDMSGTVLGEWMRDAFPLETHLKKIGPLTNRLYEPDYSGDSDNPSWKTYKGLHLFKTERGVIYVPPNARMTGTVARYNPETMQAVEYVAYEGGCGFEQMRHILYMLGYDIQRGNVKRRSSQSEYVDMTLLPTNKDTYYGTLHNVLLLPEEGDLVFQYERQEPFPEDSHLWDKEVLFDWIHDEDNVFHKEVRVPVIDVATKLPEVLTEYLGKYEERSYVVPQYKHDRERSRWGAQWSSVNNSRVRDTGLKRTLHTLSLDIEKSNIQIVKFSEVNEHEITA